MDNDSKKIIHTENNQPINNIVDIVALKTKKKDYKLMALWVIVGFLALLLVYYAYEMIYIYF